MDQTGRVIEMSEPQVWTLIAVFAAALVGILTLMSTMFVRVVRGEIAGLRGELLGEIGGLRGEVSGEIGALRGELTGEIASLRGDLQAVSARIDGLDRRMDHLDRDVQTLVRRVFPEN